MNNESFIHRDSIMNFDEGCIVDFYGREGFVEFVNGKTIGVRFLDKDEFKNLNYQMLHVKRGPYPNRQNNQKKAWKPQELAYLSIHINASSESLAKILGRSVNAVNIQKHHIKSAV